MPFYPLRDLGNIHFPVVLKPEERIGEVFLCMTLKEHENTSKQFAEGKVIRHNNPTVVLTGGSIGLGKLDKVFHVKGQENSVVLGGEDKLFGVRAPQIVGFLRGEAIYASVPQHLRKQGINIFIEVEFDCH